MSYHEIIARDSRPYIAIVTIDPADHPDLERWADRNEAVEIIRTDTSTADVWTVHLGCASEGVADLVVERWN